MLAVLIAFVVAVQSLSLGKETLQADGKVVKGFEMVMLAESTVNAVSSTPAQETRRWRGWSLQPGV